MSSTGPSGSGSIAIVGSSRTAAPSSSSRLRSVLACSRARVTTMVRPKSGRRLEPAQVQCGDRTDHDRARRRHPERGDRRERRARRRLLGSRSPAHRGHRRLRIATVLDEQIDDRLEPAGAHEDHQRASGPRQRRPIGVGRALGRILVTGDDREVRREPAMRHRDPRVRGRGDRAGDPGDDLERDPRGDQHLGFLTAAPEHERIATLEPNHDPAGSAVLDERRVDAVLVHGDPARRLADVDAQRRPRARDRAATGCASRSYTTTSARPSNSAPRHGDQPRVTRPRADQVHGHRRTTVGTVSVETSRPRSAVPPSSSSTRRAAASTDRSASGPSVCGAQHRRSVRRPRATRRAHGAVRHDRGRARHTASCSRHRARAGTRARRPVPGGSSASSIARSCSRVVAVVRTALDRQRALPHHREHHLTSRISAARSARSSRSSAAAATTTASKSAARSTRVGDVAAELAETQIGPAGRELRPPAHRAGPDRAPGGNRVQGRADQRVADIGSFRHRGEHEPARGDGRKVLGGVHREIGVAPRSTSPGLPSRTRRSRRWQWIALGAIAVALGRDDHQLGRTLEQRGNPRWPATVPTRCLAWQLRIVGVIRPAVADVEERGRARPSRARRVRFRRLPSAGPSARAAACSRCPGSAPRRRCACRGRDRRAWPGTARARPGGHPPPAPGAPVTSGATSRAARSAWNRSSSSPMISRTVATSRWRSSSAASVSCCEVVDIVQRHAGNLGRARVDVARNGNVDDQQRDRHPAAP